MNSVLFYLTVFLTSFSWAEMANNLQGSSISVKTDTPSDLIQINHAVPVAQGLRGSSIRRPSPRLKMFNELFGEKGDSDRIDHLLRDAKRRPKRGGPKRHPPPHAWRDAQHNGRFDNANARYDRDSNNNRYDRDSNRYENDRNDWRDNSNNRYDDYSGNRYDGNNDYRSNRYDDGDNGSNDRYDYNNNNRDSNNWNNKRSSKKGVY